MASWKIPFGNGKGELLTETDASNIEWVMSNIKKKLADDPNKPYADKDRLWIAAAEAELKRRSDGGQQAPKSEPERKAEPPRARTSTPDALIFNSGDPASITAWFLENREKFHIITPATVVQSLPPGCEVSITLIYVDADAKNKEVYVPDGESGRLSLGGTPLNRIAMAAGVNWDPSQSGQVDDGNHPNLCRWRVVGAYRLFDGTAVVDQATKNIDLREGSARIEGKSDNWKRQHRTNIVEMAESKAKNRFIRRLGIKPSYTPQELEKPFAVARLMFTGRTEDPELRRAFAMLNAEKMMSGVQALFGPAPGAEPIALPPARPMRQIITARPAREPARLASPRDEHNDDEADYGGDEEPDGGY